VAYFTDETFDFLFDLDVHNDRAWFRDNRDRYEAHVKEPMYAFVTDLAGPLAREVSPHLQCVPRINGGSVFRINRDTRFSDDTRPYKSNAGAQFRHLSATADVHAPGLHVHLEPGNCFTGGGLYRPPTTVLTPIRQRVVDQAASWSRTRNAALAAGFELGGDRLRTHPRGFDPEHVHADDLARTSFVLTRPFEESDATSDDFLDTWLGWASDQAPFLRWTCTALSLPF
jgi:uncharacterized protein (TIGR02453 family)